MKALGIKQFKDGDIVSLHSYGDPCVVTGIWSFSFFPEDPDYQLISMDFLSGRRKVNNADPSPARFLTLLYRAGMTMDEITEFNRK